MHRSSPNWVSVGEDSDRLQLIKFWRSCATGKGVCGGAKIFGSALLQPARSVCVSPSAFFIVAVVVVVGVAAAAVSADDLVLLLVVKASDSTQLEGHTLSRAHNVAETTGV